MPPEVTDQPQPSVAESSVEDRLTAFFGGPKAAPPQQPTPESEPQSDPDIPQPADDQEPVAEQQADESDETETTEAPSLEEVDWNGKRYSIPAELKPALMMQADYTRKTQELAEVRKALESEKFVMNSNAQFQQQVQPLLDKQRELASYKEQAKKIDWTQLSTDQKIDLDRELRSIDQQLSELNGQIGTSYQAHQQQFGQAVLHAVAATESFMAKQVPNWNEAEGNQLHQYGLWLGIPKAKLTTGWFADPVATHVMWKAQQWDMLLYSKPQVANKSSNAPPFSKPGSNAVQGSVKQSEYRKARDQLKKSGSLEDAAKLFLRMK